MNEPMSLGVSVMIGMPVDNPIPHYSAASLAKTMYAAGRNGIAVSFAIEVSGLVQVGRDKVLADFLASDCDKLFWIDSDMVWEPKDFARMVALSTQYDVVCAAYPLKVAGPTQFVIKCCGTDREINRHGLMEIEATGLGFTIVDRAVCEALVEGRRRYKDQLAGREVAKVFDVSITDDGNLLTEDILFFNDIRALGHKVWLDTEVELGHIGEMQWRGRSANAFTQNAEQETQNAEENR